MSKTAASLRPLDRISGSPAKTAPSHMGVSIFTVRALLDLPGRWAWDRRGAEEPRRAQSADLLSLFVFFCLDLAGIR